MMAPPMTMRLTTRRAGRSSAAPLAFALCVAVGACGDDAAGADGAGAGDATGGGEPCPQAGFSATDCSCGGATMGHRTCGDDRTWSACACPPREEKCMEGERIVCTCPRDAGQRETTCLTDGTFDCPCGTAPPYIPPDASSDLDAG
jgi:hypothetical protein